MSPDALAETLAVYKNKFDAAETRPDATKHTMFVGEYCLRWEYMCSNEILQLLNLVAMKQAYTTKRGSVAQVLACILRRSLPTESPNIPKIRVVSTRESGFEGFTKRCYSGINKLPNVPPRSLPRSGTSCSEREIFCATE